AQSLKFIRLDRRGHHNTSLNMLPFQGAGYGCTPLQGTLPPAKIGWPFRPFASSAEGDKSQLRPWRYVHALHEKLLTSGVSSPQPVHPVHPVYLNRVATCPLSAVRMGSGG
ncbi:MAG: hypothetical protein KC587_19790, partial [Nitrospira sp.]|nr:hypothetical protein [Nitrospira sp.]